MAQVTETFAAGNEQVEVALTVDLPSGGETILTGDIGGLVAAGTTARLRGNCRLTADLHVRGTLLCDSSGVDLDGQNLYDIHTHDGTLNLQGVEKTAWAHWGDVVAGWQIGDRLVVSPTAVAVYTPTEITWQGSWMATPRPANSPDVTLFTGEVMRPEVANLSQTNTFRNLKRVMIHEATAPNPQTLKWIRFLDCGAVNEFDFYPIHFHMIYDHARGSLLEGVVVEGGKNHAFATHASHGITLKNCVAYNTINTPYWWNQPVGTSTADNSDDTTWEKCLAIGVVQAPSSSTDFRLTAFLINAGNRNRCIDSVATCVKGTGKNQSGFKWPENFVWEFDRCVAHNTQVNGIFTWTNSPERHIIDNFTAYHFSRAGIEHGAYLTQFIYRNCVLHVARPRADGSSRDTFGVLQHSNARAVNLLFENIISDDRLVVESHGLPPSAWTIHKNCQYTKVGYNELGGSNANPSRNRYEDCGLTPADFDLAGIHALSEIEIFEGGVLTARWAGGWN